LAPRALQDEQREKWEKIMCIITKQRQALRLLSKTFFFFAELERRSLFEVLISDVQQVKKKKRLLYYEIFFENDFIS